MNREGSFDPAPGFRVRCEISQQGREVEPTCFHRGGEIHGRAQKLLHMAHTTGFKLNYLKAFKCLISAQCIVTEKPRVNTGLLCDHKYSASSLTGRVNSLIVFMKFGDQMK